MKIASYNMENLFERAKALNTAEWLDKPGADPSRWEAGRSRLEAFAALNAILCKERYGAADKKRIVELLGALGLQRSDENSFVILRQNRGHLVKRPRGRPPRVVAEGRDDWIGWLELARETVDEEATRNTARIVKAVDADVLAVIEAENRIALLRFNEQVMAGPHVGGVPYAHAMLIDGNDDRGIDVGVFTRTGYPIVSMCSHVDDSDERGRRIFSRDCARYEIRSPRGATFTLLINHFKSKGFGSQAASNARRRAQAARVREIYDALRRNGADHIAVVGDFNDTPRSAPLAPLLADGSDLRDVSDHPRYESDGRPGTFGNGTAGNKIDYILLSPAMFDRVQRAGVVRTGVWGGRNGTLFPHLDTITRPSEAASDHAAIWADIDL